jgi:cytoskeletal protein RodZ
VTEKLASLPPNHPTLESLGQFLKEEREKASLTRSDISSRTKISLDQIAILEDGKLPNMAPVYARGFLKSYADLLNLDTESIVSEYRQLTQCQQEEAQTLYISHVPTNLNNESKSSTLTIVALLLVALALLVAGFFISPSFRETITSILPDTLNEQVASILPSNTDQAAHANPTPIAEAQIAETSPAVFSGRLTLKAESATWAQVSVDDQPVEHLLLEPGQSRSFDGQNIINVICGNGQALRTEWNGQDHGLLGQSGPVEVSYQLSPPKSNLQVGSP